PDPSPYGRFVCDPDGTLARIVEARDATPEERRIGLCNGGIMAVDARQLFALVDKIGNDNAKREFYLTDIVGIARAQGLLCRAVELRPRNWPASTPAPSWPRQKPSCNSGCVVARWKTARP